jgi:Spy/CpxP family protein refolding chaperone
MNKKTIFLLVMVLLVSSLAPAQDGRRPRTNLLNNLRFGLYMAENNLFEARLVLRLKGEIGLAAQQEQKIENLMLAYEESAIRRGSDVKVLELKFASLLKGNRIDRREMEKQAREIGRLKTDLQVGHLNYLLDVRDVLTAEQVQKLDKMKEKFRGTMRERMERKGPRFPLPPGAPEDVEEEPPQE